MRNIFSETMSTISFSYVKKVETSISGSVKRTAHHRAVSGLRISGILPVPSCLQQGKIHLYSPELTNYFSLTATHEYTLSKIFLFSVIYIRLKWDTISTAGI